MCVCVPNKLKLFEMPIYSGNCAPDTFEHYSDPCGDKKKVYAKVRSSFFVRSGYYDTFKANPLSQAVWDAGLLAKQIIVIPAVAGNYDAGDPKEGKGYGDQSKSYGAKTMKLVFNDPDLVDNYNFYNNITEQKDFIPGFVMDKWLRLFDAPGVIKAKDSISDNIDEEVDWQVDIEVVSGNLPTYHDATALKKTVFTATYLNNLFSGAPAFTTQPANQTSTDGSATINYVITGTDPITVQGQKSTDGLTWTNVAGATRTQFQATGLATGTKLRVIATNAKGNKTSDAATITVNAPLTFDTVIDMSASNSVENAPAGITFTIPGPAGGTAGVKLKANKRLSHPGAETTAYLKKASDGSTLGTVDTYSDYVNDTLAYTAGGVDYPFTFKAGNISVAGL